MQGFIFRLIVSVVFGLEWLGDIIHRLKYDGWIAGDSVQASSVYPFTMIEVKHDVAMCRPVTVRTFPSEVSFLKECWCT